MAVATQITNQELADRIGVHHSMASRLLNGQRLPGLPLAEKIGQEFNISWAKILKARGEGAEAFGELLRERCQPLPPSQRSA